MSSAIPDRSWTRLRTDRDPLRLLFGLGLWAAGWYLLSYLVVGVALFTAITTVTATSASLVVVWAGLPMLIGTAYFIRGCVFFERKRARTVVPEGLPELAPIAPSEGFFGLLKAQWKDRATQRGLVHFVLVFVPLYTLTTIVVGIWISLLGTVTLPIWYRYIPVTFDNGTKAHGVAWGYFPNGPHGPGRWGFWIGSDGSATVAALVSLVLLLAFNYIVVATARIHVNAVRAVIADYRDPLAEAKQVLIAPGPLGTAVDSSSFDGASVGKTTTADR